MIELDNTWQTHDKFLQVICLFVLILMFSTYSYSYWLEGMNPVAPTP